MGPIDSTELLVQQERGLVQATMNRPAALNALTLDMVRLFSSGLAAWDRREDVKAICIRGAGGTAFCAGGDVKRAWHAGLSFRRGEAEDCAASLFFGEEYRLNRRLFHYRKPLIALMNGIAMGGGFGIGGPCRYRIVSERTVFAMPETAIGFFPDVGSTYFLNRAPGQAGAALAMTGGKIGPEDMLYCGFATHYIPLERQAAFLKTLDEAIWECRNTETLDADITGIFADFSIAPAAQGSLQAHESVIERCFAGNDAEEILERLLREPSEWAAAQASVIKTRSPLSVAISLAHLRKAQSMSFDEITAQDFTLARHFMRGHDFYEGVRALLVDKDNRPRWEHATLAEVPPETVARYFTPSGPALDEIAA